MAQTGYTPIQLYYSTTTSNVPSAGNLASGELAINITDGKLFYKDNGGSVQVIAWKTTPTTAGGTGLTSWTAGDLPYYATGTTLSKLGIGTNGQILTSTGTAPQWSTLSGVAVTTFSAGTTGFTPSSATSGAVTLAGTLATTNGGTGLTSFTANGVVYASSTSALTTGSDVVYTGNFGIGTSSPTYKLNVVSGAGAQNIFQAGQSGVSNGYTITSDGTNLTYQWFTPSTEAMRLTSTGLGIGTSSPDQALVVNKASGSTYLKVSGANNVNNDLALHFTDGTNNAYFGMMRGTSGGVAGALHSYTGGAIRSTLDSSGNLGLGVTPSAWGTGYKAFQIGDSALSNYGTGYAFLSQNALFGTSTNTYINSAAASYYRQFVGTHAWFTAPSGTAGNAISFTQAMTLTAAGDLGVGTTSPGSKLDVSGNVNASNYQILGSVASQAGTFGFLNSNGPAIEVWGSSSGNAGSMLFKTAGTERLRIDSAGNLGLGVAPSAWGSVYKALQLTDGAAFVEGGGNTYVGNNWYNNGSSGIYIANGAAAVYGQSNGQHQWFNAPSGTAGTVATFTQAMTLDASGNLGVGTTSPSARLQLSATSSDMASAFGNIAVFSSDSQAADKGGSIGFGGVYTGTSIAQWSGVKGGKENSTDGNYAGYLSFFTRANGGSTTERARITSGGDLLVGTTSAANNERLNVTKANNVFLSRFINTQASGTDIYGIFVQYPNLSPNSTISQFLRCDDSTATRFEVRSNGGIANYQANDVNLSDRREKTNFAPAKGYLDTICAIPVQTFNYIDQSEDDPGLTLGVVAQDVQAVAPELVMESNWGTEDDPKMRLSIYQTDLQYALMKCIQELKAELDTVKAELATLKGN